MLPSKGSYCKTSTGTTSLDSLDGVGCFNILMTPIFVISRLISDIYCLTIGSNQWVWVFLNYINCLGPEFWLEFWLELPFATQIDDHTEQR